MDDSAIMLLSNNLSRIYKAVGDLNKALEYQVKAVEICMKKYWIKIIPM